MEETLNLIKRRYIHERAIYTWCGIALVAVNPYQEQDIYGDQAVETYHSASHSVYLQLDPHIYAVTEDAYSKLERNLKDQSIIVSGESGAGKTVSAKHAMRYLASIASSKTKLKIENRVLASNPIMEAIGNAMTARNDNSSRFGKYIQIYFDRNNRKILGANMRTYLLEKSRVTKQQPGERNFHIFYQLLNYAHKNPGKMSHLELADPENENRLRRFEFLGGREPVESRDDLRKFNEALRTLNIDEKRVDTIYRIIAGILHGGNIEFKPIVGGDDSNGSGAAAATAADSEEANCTIDMGSFHFRACCELLGLDMEKTRQSLTTKLLRTGPREIIVQPLRRKSAEYARNAMLKYIYECLFSWLVGLINTSLGSKELVEEQQQAQQLLLIQQQALKSPTAGKPKSILDHHQISTREPQFIGVLDIYGFENFKTNSFEQFCINYANEVLQQQYNQHVFKLEQEEYIREGIDWTFIEYSDNQPVIDIIESRPIGILNLLDEECRMPKGTDQSWCAKLYDHLLSAAPAADGARSGSSKRAAAAAADGKSSAGLVFRKPKLNYQNSFNICHYAEEVSYDVATFLEKNRDTLAEEQSELLQRSDVLSYIFEDPKITAAAAAAAPASRRSRHSSTVGHQFRLSLAALIKTLNATEPHYIRCIKPNDEKRAFEFNEKRAVEQLKACGVYETIRISNNGFPSRWSYREFAKRYCVLIYATQIFEKLASSQLAAATAAAAANAHSAGCADSSSDSGHSKSASGAGSENETTSAHDGDDDDDSREQLLLVDANANLRGRRSRWARLMSQLGPADSRLVCEAICRIAYEDNSVYGHLRTKEEQDYIDTLIERHGNKPSAIYQFGKSKIFFRAGQVGYLERVRSTRLREYTITIQRYVRGWLARCAYAKRREQFLEELRREASMVSLQNQVSSLQNELEQVKVELEEEVHVEVSRLGSVYQLAVDIMCASVQPLIIAAVLEYEALDAAAPADVADPSMQAAGTEQQQQLLLHPMDDLVKELDKYHDLTVKNSVPDDIAVETFKQIFYLICAQSLNQLLIRRDLCQFRKAMQINFNLSCLVQWCRERFPTQWREIVEQLDPIIQATKLLQTRKLREDIDTIEEVCNKLRPSQIIKLLNMYTSSYEEQVSTDFIHELEVHLNRNRKPLSQDEAGIYIPTSKYLWVAT